MIEWAIAFALTFGMELVVVRRAPIVVLGAQLATHPLVWIGIATLPLPLTPRLFVLELGAVLVEAAIYRRAFRLRTADALALSAFANAASLGLSALLDTFL